jgi:two-component system sensor histidine kinase TctE
VLWVWSAYFAYTLSVSIAEGNYDRELVNSADSVAVRTRQANGHVVVDLPSYVRDLLRHDNQDHFYYQVLNDDGLRIAGDTGMPHAPMDLTMAQPRFFNATYRGQKVRVACILEPISNLDEPGRPIMVMVAETLNARQAFARQLLFSMSAPELLIIILGAFAVWLGISRGLRPLKELEQALSRRTQYDLSPVSADNVPVEVQPLVASINGLLDRLRSDLDSQRRFVANAAHQLRTPLAGIKTYLGLMEDSAKEPQTVQIVQQLSRGVNRMAHLVNKLLALAKAEPHASNFAEKKVFDLNDVAAEAITSLVAEALEKHIELGFERAEEKALMEGDPAMLHELVMNLVDNAIHYTPAGGRVTGLIVVSDKVIVCVEDNGPGIPEAERERVFERFYRVLGTEVQGSGLGLPIVKEVARAHGGTISINTPASGRGTIICVEFPSALARAPENALKEKALS